MTATIGMRTRACGWWAVEGRAAMQRSVCMQLVRVARDPAKEISLFQHHSSEPPSIDPATRGCLGFFALAWTRSGLGLVACRRRGQRISAFPPTQDNGRHARITRVSCTGSTLCKHSPAETKGLLPYKLRSFCKAFFFLPSLPALPFPFRNPFALLSLHS